MQAQGQVARRLTSDQVTFFEREGYLIIEDLLTHEELQPVVDEISEAIDMQARRLVASGELSRLYDEYDFEHRLTKICEETDKVALGIWAGQPSGPAFFDLIRNPSLLDVAEQFCGPELIGSSLYRLRPKVPNNLISAVPWHQDSAYAEEFCDEHLMLTFWIALVDATEENGCMWVIPRTHQGGVLPHKNPRDGRPYLIIPKDRLPPDRPPVCVPVRKGGALLMTNRTPHASFDNRTDRVRYSIDIRYQSAQLPTNAPITRLEGEFVGSEEGDVPPACYPPEADFLLRSRRRPDEVITTAAEFNRIRSEHIRRATTPRTSPKHKRWTAAVEE